MVTYDHSVKVNGKWYGAGEVVEATPSASVTAEDKKQVSTVTETKDDKKRSSNKKESE